MNWQLNNTTDLELIVLSPTPATASTINQPVLLANQELTLLSSTDGKRSIPPRAKMSFSFNQDDAPKDLLVHDLYVCRADNLFPVAVFNLSVLEPVEELIVSKDDQRLMELGAKFQQTISVYPNSKLARDFFAVIQEKEKSLEAITSGTIQGESNNAGKKFDAFFQSTEAYQALHEAQLAVVQDYYHRYPMVWATDEAYPIYSIDDLVAPITRTLIGSLAFIKPDQLAPEKVNAGYQCVFTTVSGEEQSLTFTNGFFVDDPQAEKPALGLGTVFVQEKLTRSGRRPAQVTTILVGRVNGDSCLGLAPLTTKVNAQVKSSSQKGNNTSDWDSFFHSYKSVLAILGALSFLMSSFSFFRTWQLWRQARRAASPPATSQDVSNARNQLRADLTLEVDRVIEYVQTSMVNTSNIGRAIHHLITNQGAIRAEQGRNLLEKTVADLAESIERLSEQMGEMNEPQIQMLESQPTVLEEINDELGRTDIEDLGQVVIEGMQQLEQVTKQVRELFEGVKGKLSEVAKESIAEGLRNTESIVTRQESFEETEDAETESLNPEAEIIESY